MPVIRVKVKLHARSGRLEPAGDGFIAYLKSPPVDGRANAELIALVAEHFGCNRSRVSIRSGAASRIKFVSVED